jgi:acid phosphatase (class A)
MNATPFRIATALVLSLIAAPFATAADGSADRPDPAYYIAPKDLDLSKVVKAPAKDDSAETRKELDVMLAIQAKRTPAECQAANADARIEPMRFADALGLPESARIADLRKVREFFDRMTSFEGQVLENVKEKYARARPYVVDPKITPCIEMPRSKSYPSGHAAWAYMTATVLTDMYPKRKDALMKRAGEFARHRITGGVHYPSDVDAGKTAGQALAAKLLGSAKFHADEAVARKELEAARVAATH